MTQIAKPIIATDPKAREFVKMWQKDPNVDKKIVAKALGVSRQTVYNWIAKIQSGKPLGTRGKHRKYGLQRSVPMAMRLSEVVYNRMYQKLGDGTTRFVEQMTPDWYMQWEQGAIPIVLPATMREKLKERYSNDANKFLEATIVDMARSGLALRTVAPGTEENDLKSHILDLADKLADFC